MGIEYVFVDTAMADADKTIPLYSIGTVARILGVSVETLRMYERKGLIIVRKSEGNQRLYTERDVERLRCIRAAIRDRKISVEGIRRLQSMIPCWIFINCPMEERLACPAYRSPEAGCWTYKHEVNACAGRPCIECDVYIRSADCEGLKTLVHQHPGPSVSETLHHNK
jgi:MerR family transcriptional regulator/heat shock protein HspR